MDKNSQHYIQCDMCGKPFSYTDDEVKDGSMYNPFTEEDEPIQYVNCPHCRFEVYL